MNNNKHIIVLGAGVVGVTTAWYLRQAGYDVTVIDRQPAVAEETSKANGGQISVSHAEPWANPYAPKQILTWLFNTNAPLRFQLSTDKAQLAWCLQFLRACNPKRNRENIKQLVTLGIYSRSCLQTLRHDLQLNYQQKQKGILHFYTDVTMFERAKKSAQYMQSLGCERDVLSTQEALTTEPALASIDSMVGATYTKADESGNAYEFTQQLTQHCIAAGVNFLFNTQVNTLKTDADQVTGLSITNISDPTHPNQEVFADDYVLCLGSFSAEMTRNIGIPLHIYPAKGYSTTFHVTDSSQIPQTSLIDDAYKLVFSRFQTHTSDVLRVAGMAEIQPGRDKYNTDINLQRAALITNRVQTLFPQGLDFSEPNYWTGLRPTTPSNVPYIGQSKYQNLYLNTGHGTLGWTHACGSAQALSDIMQGKTPKIDFAFQTT